MRMDNETYRIRVEDLLRKLVEEAASGTRKFACGWSWPFNPVRFAISSGPSRIHRPRSMLLLPPGDGRIKSKDAVTDRNDIDSGSMRRARRSSRSLRP